MNFEISFKSFVFWVIAGMGFRLGWGLVALVFDFVAKAAHGG